VLHQGPLLHGWLMQAGSSPAAPLRHSGGGSGGSSRLRRPASVAADRLGMWRVGMRGGQACGAGDRAATASGANTGARSSRADPSIQAKSDVGPNRPMRAKTVQSRHAAAAPGVLARRHVSHRHRQQPWLCFTHVEKVKKSMLDQLALASYAPPSCRCLPPAAACVGKSGAGSMPPAGCHHSRNCQYSQSTAARKVWVSAEQCGQEEACGSAHLAAERLPHLHPTSVL